MPHIGHRTVEAHNAGDCDAHTCPICALDEDPTPCCPDPDCTGAPCTFPGYAENH